MNPTKAFVWAAGLGTRLRPYTHETPKPMLRVLGLPMIEYVLRYLAHAGVREVTVNAWHLGEQFEPLPALAAEFGQKVTLSRQPQRYEHGGDLAYARAFLDGLGPDEAFYGLNGDTLFWVDPARLHEAAARVSADAPACLLVHTTDSTPLHAAGDRLVGIGSVTYVPDVEPSDAWDDFGIKVFHASIREHLPKEPGTLSFHGQDGVVGRLTRAGRRVLVAPVRDYDRVEIGTVEDYEGHEADDHLRALADRLAALP
jgi:N-acetyl-alpha-D-muramate 1-phosphate uridylyltransferase